MARLGDRARSILQADHDRVRKDVVEQVVGSPLEPVALLHEVPDDREGHDGGRDQVERCVGRLVARCVSLPCAGGRHREHHRAEEDREPRQRSPQAGYQQRRERDREAEHHDQSGLEQAAEQRRLGEVTDRTHVNINASNKSNRRGHRRIASRMTIVSALTMRPRTPTHV